MRAAGLPLVSFLAAISACAPSDDRSAGCSSGEHDGGDGSCVKEGKCIHGFGVEAHGRCAGFERVAPRPRRERIFAAGALGDGRMVLAGGFTELDGDVPRALNSVHIYDPKADEWTDGPALVRGIHQAKLTPLDDGGLLLVGGARGLDVVRETWILDANASAWSAGPALSIGRILHGAQTLKDGRVLVYGGRGPDGFFDTLESLAPGASEWQLSETTGETKTFASIVELDDEVLIASGGSETCLTLTPPLFVPYAGAALSAWRAGAGVAPIDGAQLVVAGGLTETNELTDIVEIYDSATRGFHPGAPLPVAAFGEAFVVDGGDVLFVGDAGFEPNTLAAALFDAAHDRWTPVPLDAPFNFDDVVQLADHSVYVIKSCKGVSTVVDPECVPEMLRFVRGK